MELFAFDDDYLKRLRDGDPSTERHFVVYFSQLLHLKLRARFLSPDAIDDLRQETFTRVFRTLRANGGLREANRLGAFVNSVCNNVLLEHYRAGNKSVPLEPGHTETQDKVINVEKLAIAEEARKQVHKILAQLPQRDQSILRAVFWEEQPKDDVCRRFGVSRDYLRVLVHRAKGKFRSSIGP